MPEPFRRLVSRGALFALDFDPPGFRLGWSDANSVARGHRCLALDIADRFSHGLEMWLPVQQMQGRSPVALCRPFSFQPFKQLLCPCKTMQGLQHVPTPTTGSISNLTYMSNPLQRRPLIILILKWPQTVTFGLANQHRAPLAVQDTSSGGMYFANLGQSMPLVRVRPRAALVVQFSESPLYLPGSPASGYNYWARWTVGIEPKERVDGFSWVSCYFARGYAACGHMLRNPFVDCSPWFDVSLVNCFPEPGPGEAKARLTLKKALHKQILAAPIRKCDRCWQMMTKSVWIVQGLSNYCLA